jgi:acetyl esterase
MSANYYPQYTQGELAPQAQVFLTRILEANRPLIYTLTPPQARNAMWPGLRNLQTDPEAVAAVEDRAILGPGGDIPIRVYTPAGRGPFPITVYFHGGGWVMWEIDVTDNLCRSLTNGASCVVVSVGYRLAPEHKHPAAIEDAYRAVEWVATNAEGLNGTTDRIAVAGDSAGGNLAAVVAQMARDQGRPGLVFQLLICPVTNLASLNTDSYCYFGDGLWLPKAMVQWGIDNYLENESQAQSPYVSPLLATDLSNLPPALVLTAEFDVLRDEGEAYARRLQEAGTPASYSQHPGMLHDFLLLTAVFPQANDAIAEAAAALRQAFTK